MVGVLHAKLEIKKYRLLGGGIIISRWKKELIQNLWLPTGFLVLVKKWVYMKYCGITQFYWFYDCSWWSHWFSKKPCYSWHCNHKLWQRSEYCIMLQVNM